MVETKLAESPPKEIIPQNTTPPFKVTNAMIRWFNAAIELGYGASLTSIADKAKVDRTTWYEWKKDARFVEWWDTEWKKHLGLSKWKLDAIGLKKAETDREYWLDMMKRTGNIQEEGKASPLSVQVNQFVNKEKDEFGI